MNWNFQEILTKDPSSALGCDTLWKHSPLWSGTKQNLQMYQTKHLLKTQICVTRLAPL
jgi:hypothetical protein